MPPAKLNKTRRFINPEVTKTYWIETFADINAPQRAEIDAGVDLTDEIAGMTGFEVRADRVPTPDLGSKKTGRITGRVNPGDAQITFYGDRGTQDIRDVLSRGDRGHIMILDGGDIAGQKARVFAVEVSAITPTTDVAGTESARIMVDFSIEDWAEEVTIPALA